MSFSLAYFEHLRKQVAENVVAIQFANPKTAMKISGQGVLYSGNPCFANTESIPQIALTLQQPMFHLRPAIVNARNEEYRIRSTV